MLIRAKTAPSEAVPTVRVGTTVPTTSGSWSRSTAREVPIADLQKKFGWADGSWQADLLKAADSASSTASRKGNGSVSAAEVESYLQKPDDSRFLTSAALQQERSALDQKLTGNTRSVDVDSFDSDWQDTVAKRADMISGDSNGKLSRAELDTYFRDLKDGKVEDSEWVPDQKSAMFESKVAESAGELDPLRPDGADSGVSLLKEYMRLSMDPSKNVPSYVSYMLSAADIQETPEGVDRDKSSFVKDPELGSAGVSASDYDGTGLDRGHMKPAEDSPTQEAMDESHLMSNIAPQQPNLNRQAWRTLEAAVNDMVASSGGKAYIITGNLYLDSKGQPLPPEAIDTIGAHSRKVAVPTHQFKTVLLEKPDGELSMFAYMVPNQKDAPTKKEDILPFLEKSRTSVDHLEELLGKDLYAQLPESVQAKLEADSSAQVAFKDAEKSAPASSLWQRSMKNPVAAD